MQREISLLFDLVAVANPKNPHRRDRSAFLGRVPHPSGLSVAGGRDGIEVLAESTLVYTVRNRKIARICLDQETDEALKAVGLVE